MDDINKKIQDLIKLRNIQGRKGNYDYDDYMLGLFNGLELAVSTLEGREPNFKSKEVAEKKIEVIKKDITDINFKRERGIKMDDINKKIQDLIELRNIQGRKGNYDYDDYMLGLFNGLELAVSTLEGREPNFKSKGW